MGRLVQWDGWMASLTQWTWVWVNSGSWWWTGRSGVLRFMGSQRVGHDWATDLNWMSTMYQNPWKVNLPRVARWRRQPWGIFHHGWFESLESSIIDDITIGTEKCTVLHFLFAVSWKNPTYLEVTEHLENPSFSLNLLVNIWFLWVVFHALHNHYLPFNHLCSFSNVFKC